MRKLLLPMFALLLAIGCHHVAGSCDCDGPADHCRFSHTSGLAYSESTVPSSPTPATPIPAPKIEEKK